MTVSDPPPPPPDLAPPDLADRGWALFLDVDGTLLEHAEHPDAVSVGPELRTLLVRLEQELDGALAFVTGRSIAAVDRLFDPLKLRAAGLYGLEHRLDPAGPVTVADAPRDLAALANEIEAELGHHDVYVERKGPVLAIHTRAAPQLLAQAETMVRRALATLPNGYHALVGNAGLELMPLEAVKGGAIRRFMGAEPFKGRRPVFLGDDTSDENGFDAVNELGGLSIRVRPRGATVAHHAIAGVRETLRWLERQSLAIGLHVDPAKGGRVRDGRSA